MVDTDYRGNVCVTLYNHSVADLRINVHDRVAQLVLERIVPFTLRTIHDPSFTIHFADHSPFTIHSKDHLPFTSDGPTYMTDSIRSCYCDDISQVPVPDV